MILVQQKQGFAYDKTCVNEEITVRITWDLALL